MSSRLLDNNWRLNGVENAWVLERKVVRKDKKTGREIVEWRAKKWYTSISGALGGWADLAVREAPGDLVDAIRDVHSELEKMRLLFEAIYGGPAR